MVNEKFRENVPAWEVTDLNYFIAFLLCSLKLLQSNFLLIIFLEQNFIQK